MLASELKLVSQPSPRPGSIRTIAVTSGKGGVGKTSIATNLSLALAINGHRTMLLDADMGMANVDVLLGIHADKNLLDVLNGNSKLEDIVINGPHDLKIIPAASGKRELASLGACECAGIVHAFSEVSDGIDTLVIDTATGIADSVATFCRASNDILVVAGHDPAALKDSIALVTVLHTEYGINRFRLLPNMVQDEQEGLRLYAAFQKSLHHFHEVIVTYAGFVPFDEHVRQAANAHEAVIEASPKSRAAMAVANLAQRVNHWPLPRTALGHTEFFVERLINQNNVEMEVKS